MVSNQVLGARLTAGLLTLSFALTGCALFRHTDNAAPPPATAAVASTAPAAETAAAPEPTATEAAIETAGSQAQPATQTPVPASAVNPTAPKSYVVKKGDTLWGIASMFLKDPWLWPEVWIINPNIPNPHLIYPGDTLALAYGANGSPQVTVVQGSALRLEPSLRSHPLDAAIPTVPYSSIQAFLSHPTLLTGDQIKSAPYVLGFRDMHQVGGNGIEVYVSNLNAEQNARYAVMHVGDELRDPDDNSLIGYEGVYTATALVERPGSPAKALLIDTAMETEGGDRLVTSAEEANPVNFTLRAPATDVHGRIVAVINGTDLVGQFAVVAINRGKRHGLEPGNVLAIDAAGDVVKDMYRNGTSRGDKINSPTMFAPKVKLPDERSGTLLVFKVFDRMSYGLIVGASDTIHRLDVVHNP
jgi:hypothetical protein